MGEEEGGRANDIVDAGGVTLAGDAVTPYNERVNPLIMHIECVMEGKIRRSLP